MEMTGIKIDIQQVYQGNLILVNARHPVRREIRREQLINITAGRKERGSVRMEKQAGKILLHMLANIDYNSRIVAVSGYRTGEEQSAIYDSSLYENGRAFTEQYVALPGCSEHQTGLAIDLGEEKERIDYIRPDFPYTGICQRFREKAPEFGFVERYPKGKEAVTGIAQEPWHFRYVGVPHSLIMTEKGMVLEEYVEFLKRYLFGEAAYICETEEGIIEISYLSVKREEGKEQWARLPADVPFQVSGDNKEGIILTVFRELGAKGRRWRFI